MDVLNKKHAGDFFSLGQGLVLAAAVNPLAGAAFGAAFLGTKLLNHFNKSAKPGDALKQNAYLLGITALATIGAVAAGVLTMGMTSLLLNTAFLGCFAVGNWLKGHQINGNKLQKGLPEVFIGLGSIAVAALSGGGSLFGGEIAAYSMGGLAIAGTALSTFKQDDAARVPFMAMNGYSAFSAATVVATADPIMGGLLALGNLAFLWGNAALAKNDFESRFAPKPA